MPDTPHSPYQVGHSDPKTPFDAESDIGETTAWCDTCGDERRFVRETRTGAAEVEETESAEPDVRRALTGDTGWRCTVCGTFDPNLINDDAYDYQYSDVGYQVPQFEDENQELPDSTEGVTPPDRAEATRRPEE